MTNIICARNVKTVCNVEPKPWSQISSPVSGFLDLDLKSRVPSPRSWI